MEYYGRITGKSITELLFRAFYEEELHLGDILIAHDEERALLFYLRVVDILYGIEAADPEWAMRTAGNIMLLDSKNEPYELYEKERRLFKIGKCVPLGYLRNGQFKKPKTLPAHFSRVKGPGVEDFAFLCRADVDVRIGKLRSGEEVLDLEVGISGALMSSHIGLFATTGMGKSNLMKVLAGTIMESGGYGLLLFDPHGEYYDGGGDRQRRGLRGLSDHLLAGERLRVYSARDLSGPHNKLHIAAQEIQVNDVRFIYNFTQPQVEALYALRHRFHQHWLREVAQAEILELVTTLGRGPNFNELTLGVIQRRAGQILKLPFVHTDQTLSISQNVKADLAGGKVVLVDTSGISETEELLISAVLARAVFEEHKNQYQNQDQFRRVVPVLIVMEEAGRVLGKSPEGDLNIFAQIAREGRKFKCGLCAVSQQPKLIDPELLSQFNTLFILGLADERDRNIIKSSAKQDIAELMTEIQMLEAGEGLITSPDVPFALPVKIHLYEEWLKDRPRPAPRTMEIKVDPAFFG